MQDYKLVLRTLTPGNTVTDPNSGSIIAQNAGEFMSYLNSQYLSKGYEVKSVDCVRTIPPEHPQDYPKYEFAYHLVKELITS